MQASLGGERGFRQVLSKKGIVILATLAAAGLLVAPTPPTRASMYWGATISGEPYGQTGSAPLNQSAWDLFERHAGKKVAVLNTGQTWGSFDAAAMDATHARGAIPMVTMGLSE